MQGFRSLKVGGGLNNEVPLSIDTRATGRGVFNVVTFQRGTLRSNSPAHGKIEKA